MKLPQSMLDYSDVANTNIMAREFLQKYDIKGTMLQIGGSNGTSKKQPSNYPNCVKFWGMEYYNLDLNDNGSKHTIIGNILNAPFKNETFEFIFSNDTFEHITEPWIAAKEIIRMLKPGGLCIIITCFSWRYHTSPIDYWRFTPHCLEYLFRPLECIETNWNIRGRRGSQKDGFLGSGEVNDLTPIDSLGGWRENWRVFFIGRKNE